MIVGFKRQCTCRADPLVRTATQELILGQSRGNVFAEADEAGNEHDVSQAPFRVALAGLFGAFPASLILAGHEMRHCHA